MLAIEDRPLAAALPLIREHCCDGLDVEAIARHMLSREIRRHEKAGYAFDYNQATVRHLAALGFDSRLGARPMRTRIEAFVRKAMREALFAEPGGREISLVVASGVNRDSRQGQRN